MFHNKGAEYIHLLILMLSDIIIRIVLYYQTFKVNKIVKKCYTSQSCIYLIRNTVKNVKYHYKNLK